MPAEVMDATALSAALKELNESVTAGRADDVVRLMEDMRARVEPTEDLLRATKAGSILAKHSKSTDATIAAKAKTVVKAWKDVIEAQRKRKRENNDGEGEPAKKVKAEAGASPAISTPPTPAPTSSRDVKPKIEEPSAEESKPDIKPKMGSPPSKTGLGIPPSAVASGSRSPSPSSTAAPKQETNFETIEKDRKVPRTAKSDQMSNLQADSAGDAGGSDPVRGKCVVMIYDALAGDSTASSKIIAERAVSLERAVYESFNYSTSNDYRAKLRSLFLNLKDKGNPGLRNKIVLGNLSADQVVKMSKEEMASASVKAINEKLAKDNLFKAKAVGEIQAETNAFKCSKCQQRRCSFYQMQTRSADEPMTTFVTCLNCGNKWKFC